MTGRKSAEEMRARLTFFTVEAPTEDDLRRALLAAGLAREVTIADDIEGKPTSTIFEPSPGVSYPRMYYREPEEVGFDKDLQVSTFGPSVEDVARCAIVWEGGGAPRLGKGATVSVDTVEWGKPTMGKTVERVITQRGASTNDKAGIDPGVGQENEPGETQGRGPKARL